MSATSGELEAMLSRLKLTAIRDHLDSLLDELGRKGLCWSEGLAYLCRAEIARKDQRRVLMAQRMAKFPFDRSLDDYDFSAQPSVDPKRVRELATGRWVGNGDVVLLLGPPGVGKTHLAVGLGRAAIKAGYSVLFTQAAELIGSLMKVSESGRLMEPERVGSTSPDTSGVAIAPSIPTTGSWHGPWSGSGRRRSVSWPT